MKIKILIILFSITIILFPTQFVIGAFHEEAEQFLKEEYEKIDPIKKFKDNLQFGNIIPIEEIIKYFKEDYNFNPNNLLIEEKLLTQIFDYSHMIYSEILYNVEPLQKNEIKIIEEKFSDLEKAKSEQEFIWRDYDSDLWTVLESDGQRLIVATFSNQEEIDELNKQRGLIDEGTILLVKAMPIYDSEEQKVTTLDKTARKFTAKIPALEGSDIGKDPVRATSLMMLETNYLLHAKIIQTNDQKWISIEEAITEGYEKEDVQKAKLVLKAAKLALNANDIDEVNVNLVSFVQIIFELSQYEEQIPSWVINNAKWWTEGLISDKDFLNAIEYLVKKGIIEY